MKRFFVAAGLALISLIIYTQITIFAVPPIGAVPEGRTVIMQGYVNLICRGMTMGAVVNATTILARLPYSETIYKISTGGESYTR
jgi:hypothetical protein